MNAFWMRRGMSIAGLLAGTLSAMAQDVTASAVKPTFEVVSIKLHDANQQGTRIQMTDNTYIASNVSVKNLILTAYDVKTFDQISGVPGAIDKMNFDVEAKIDAETAATRKTLTMEQRREQQRAMMQAMLEDRFKIKVHHETREVPLYALVLAKSGFKLKEADPNDAYVNGIKGFNGKSGPGMMTMGRGQITAQGVPITNLALNLQGTVGRVIIDKTGLTGKYDLALRWTPDGAPASDAADAAPSLYTALEEQLGLKLEPTKGPVDTVVVDHIEMPTEN